MIEHQRERDLIPLRPKELLILVALAARDRHGYGIRQDILDQSGGQIKVEAAGLYRNIRRLKAAGALEQAGRRHAAESGDDRRIYYHITPCGRRVLAAEMRRLQALVRLAQEQRLIAALPP